MPTVLLLDPDFNPDMVGLIPSFLHEDDPRPAKEQFAERYSFGGDWRPIKGFTMSGQGVLSYEGDPDLEPVAAMVLREETILVYDYGLVCIVQGDAESFEVSRMD